MSFQRPIPITPTSVPLRAEGPVAGALPATRGHFETIVALIKQATGAATVTVHLKGDPFQPVMPGGEVIEVPLIQGRKRIGRLRAAAPDFAPGAHALLKGFATLLVEQQVLWAQAHVDPLTGALTRRAFGDDLTRAVSRFRRDGTPCSLIMFDLDHFKRVNDMHGHLAGDAVLREVGRLARRILRAEDRLARLGGEEFGVLVAAGLDQATEIAERLRTRLSRQVIAGIANLRVTMSLGVATCAPGIETETDLMSLADARLYAAKTMGRNRICAGPTADRTTPHH